MSKTEKQVARNRLKEPDDPVLMMLGVGRQLWEQESGEAFVERLRSEAPEHHSTDRTAKAPGDLSLRSPLVQPTIHKPTPNSKARKDEFE